MAEKRYKRWYGVRFCSRLFSHYNMTKKRNNEESKAGCIFTGGQSIKTHTHIFGLPWAKYYGCVLCVMVAITGNGLGDPSSNPGWGCMHFI